MIVKYNILFWPDCSKKDASCGPLRCKVRWCGRTATLNLGVAVEFSRWSSDVQRCKNNTTHGKKKVPAAVINRLIEEMLHSLQEFFAQASEQRPPTKEEVLAAAGRKPKKRAGSTTDLLLAYDEFMKTEGHRREWTKETFTKFNSLRRHILAFRPSLCFDDLTEKTMIDFIEYLQTPQAMQLTYNLDRGLRNTTIAKNLDFFRWFLRWSHAHGLYTGTIHESFHPKLKGTGGHEAILFLTWEELQKLYTFDFGSDLLLEKTRDLFCMECFTALRWSDVQQLSWAHIDAEVNNITMVMKKTSKRLVLPLNKYAKAIIDKYDTGERTGFVLPRLSNQKANVYIKRACKVAGIDTPVCLTHYYGRERVDETFPKCELMTTHAGRRTFVVNALSMGLSPYVVKELGGWANVSAMQPYMAIVDDARKAVADRFNSWDGKL